MTEWKPGDVAVVAGEVAIRVAYSGAREDRCFIDGLGRHWRHEDDTARPLVVIDPEDREAVARLVGHDGFLGDLAGDCDVTAMQQALRKFANPTPPKPDEPLGLGAVVEDEAGERWVRFTAKTGSWWRNHQGQNLRYADLDVVRVLSEGVQS